jgi:hypothetical protein
MKLVIVREKWLRGDDWHSTLRNDEGSMCCLGFYCRARRIPIKALIGHADPAGLDDKAVRKVPSLVCRVKDDEQGDEQFYNSSISVDLMDANDSATIRDSVREKRITRLFKKIDVEVTFR